MLLRAFGAEETEAGPVSEPPLAMACIVCGGEIATHLYSFPGSLSASSWGPVFSCCLNQWKGVSEGLSVFCQLVEQSTLSTRGSFRLGNEKRCQPELTA